MRILLIVNPSSGRGRGKQLLPEIRSHLAGASIEIVESRSQQDLIELAARATSDDFQIITAVGGDGTIHYVLTGMYQAQQQQGRPVSAALGIIPVGRGNDIARTLQIPSDLTAACRILRAGKTQALDLASTGRNVYAGVAGIGFDSEATRLANLTKLKGDWLPAAVVYSYAVLRALIGYKPKRIKLRYQGGEFDGRIMMAAISNGRAYGGGMMITPTAQVDDGLLDICIVKEVSKLRLIMSFPQVFRGQHTNHPAILYFQTNRVEVEADEVLELYGDGEYLETTPLRIEVANAALRVVIP